jgi:hypothetical protein
MTSEASRKFVPVRVTVVSPLPDGAVLGLSEAKVGVGLVGVWVPVLVLLEPQPISTKEKRHKGRTGKGLQIVRDMVALM